MIEKKTDAKSNLAESYNKQYGKSTNVWRSINGKGKAENIVNISKGHTFQKVLEVGAGEGSILYWLEQFNFSQNLYALEISQSGVEQIQNKKLKTLQEVKLFDGYQIPYEDNEFDLVICSHVIEHVEFPRMLLREIKRVSKYQVFEIPIDFSFSVDKRIKLFLSYGHINIYYPSLFRFLLLSEGFEILADKPGFYSKEVRKAYHQNRIKDLSPLGYRAFLLKENIKFMFWGIIPGLKRIRPQTYTVLCTKTDKFLKIF
jgi:ubiquinone/menaquinone biosynthesis C-methylase UbiE